MKSMSKKQIKTSDPATDNKMVIVYDGECPFCKSYVRLAALKTAIGKPSFFTKGRD